MSLPSPSPTTDVIVTGASSGIGTELARGLARRGHNLVLVVRRKDRLDALAESVRADHGVAVTVRPCDLGDAADRAALIEELRDTGVSCTALCPGPVPTEWASVAGAQSWMLGSVTVSAEQVAEDGITGMAQGKRSVVPGVVPKAVATAGRFVPRTMLLPGITLSERFRRG
ncbi:MAG: SDR family NAD(P)-dependent oxidoreductase [Actinophytocola sp.]|nr:SDR family NAD(P)-dependent oxidoreductase [Actinophytocola sp.]